MDSVQKIINDHRNLFIFSKRLSDWHMENLKKWPFICFSNLRYSKLEYDFLDESGNLYEGHVDYTINLGAEEKEKDHTSSKSALESFVKNIFFKDTKVNIVISYED